MDLINKLQEKKQILATEKDRVSNELNKLEEDFANVKLNPYGITTIDFSKRQELTADLFKIEGAMMGIDLAIELANEK